MSESFLIRTAKSADFLGIHSGMANRHGLIAGATGTGKTVTLQVLAEAFSRAGVAVFAADIKGDLSGTGMPGKESKKFSERLELLGIKDHSFRSSPVVFWDVFGEQGHPVRTTVSEMGPLLLSRLLNLNDTQTGTLSLVFKVADDNGLLLLDMKDLRAMLQFVGENASQFTTEYGKVSSQSIGAIQRSLLELENQGGDRLFGEPSLSVTDFIKTDPEGNGIINILSADKLIHTPKVYSVFLLWLLSELFENLPEAGDADRPKIVFFFDEAHLLFEDAPKVLKDKIEQVVRLIRSKGVGIYFVTQSPSDLPDDVLGQLGNRVQHALRAFTPKDQKAVKSAAQTFRPNPALSTEAVITELGIGEALVSFLDNKGTPGMVERAWILPPAGRIGPVTPEERKELISNSPFFGVYENLKDRESAYEILKKKTTASEESGASSESGETFSSAKRVGSPGPAARPKKSETPVDAFIKNAAKAAGTQIGRQVIRGVLGSIFGR